MLSRRLFLVFYTLGFLQVAASTLAVSFRLGSVTVPAEVILTLDTIAAIVATLIIFVPLHATASECRRSYSLCTEFAITRQPVPSQGLAHVMDTQTLFFRHPLAYRDCAFRGDYFERYSAEGGVKPPADAKPTVVRIL